MQTKILYLREPVFCYGMDIRITWCWCWMIYYLDWTLNQRVRSSHPQKRKSYILPNHHRHLLVEKGKMKKAGYWSNIKHRRQFLFTYAEKMGFDPMIRANWKGRTFSIRANKVRNLLSLVLFLGKTYLLSFPFLLHFPAPLLLGNRVARPIWWISGCNACWHPARGDPTDTK